MSAGKSCEHPALFKGMCVSCGKVVSSRTYELDLNDRGQKEKWKSSLTISGGVQLQLSSQEQARVQASKTRGLRDARKLALVLDLDHTLVHAVQMDAENVLDIESRKGVSRLPIEDNMNGVSKPIMLKKRPHLDYFLHKASEFCQMTIYTAGTRKYAEAVAKVIDPHRSYIADRIVSRSDTLDACSSGNDKSLSRIFLGDYSMAVILDDREDVWRGPQSAQLLLVRPYVFFGGNNAGKEVNPVKPEAPNDRLKSNSNSANSDAAAMSATAMATAAAATAATAVPAPIISLAAPIPGRIVGMAPPLSPQFTEGDDQLLRCLEILQLLHGQYYKDSNNTKGCRGENMATNSNFINEASFMNAPRNRFAQAPRNPGLPSLQVPDAALPASTTTLLTDGTTTTTTTTAASTGSTVSAAGGGATANAGAIVPASASASVATLLRKMRSQILAGCTITFSGIIPTNEVSPENHYMWNLAVSLGAQVSTTVIPRTTHLISLPPTSIGVAAQTHKVRECIQRGDVWVLHPDWLFYCRWSLAKAMEPTFMLFGVEPGKPFPNPRLDATPLTPKQSISLPAARISNNYKNNNSNSCSRGKRDFSSSHNDLSSNNNNSSSITNNSRHHGGKDISANHKIASENVQPARKRSRPLTNNTTDSGFIIDAESGNGGGDMFTDPAGYVQDDEDGAGECDEEGDSIHRTEEGQREVTGGGDGGESSGGIGSGGGIGSECRSSSIRSSLRHKGGGLNGLVGHWDTDSVVSERSIEEIEQFDHGDISRFYGQDGDLVYGRAAAGDTGATGGGGGGSAAEDDRVHEGEEGEEYEEGYWEEGGMEYEGKRGGGDGDGGMQRMFLESSSSSSEDDQEEEKECRALRKRRERLATQAGAALDEQDGGGLAGDAEEREEEEADNGIDHNDDDDDDDDDDYFGDFDSIVMAREEQESHQRETSGNNSSRSSSPSIGIGGQGGRDGRTAERAVVRNGQSKGKRAQNSSDSSEAGSERDSPTGVGIHALSTKNTERHS